MKNIFLLLLILIGCSFKKNPLDNQTNKGHQELYSEPDAPKSKDLPEGIKRIVVAATNDIEGFYRAHNIEFNDEHHKGKQEVLVGGPQALMAYLKVLRSHYSNVIMLDSGDLFSTQTKLKEVQEFYSSNGYDAVTLGLGDFNLKLPTGTPSSTKYFQDFARTSPVPLLLSNLYELKTARLVEWKGVLPYLLKEIDGVKVGIIGLIPDDVAQLTPIDNRVGLFVENMLQSTLKQARLLRSLGADLIVLMTHQGMPCGKELANELNLPLGKVNFEPRKKDACDLNNPLGTYLERLPPHLVDLVIGGRTHEKMSNYVNETLVLAGHAQGKSFSYVEFFVDTKNKKNLREMTVVHQPIMLCHEFFSSSKDCYTEDPSVNHTKRVPATFLGQGLGLTPIAKQEGVGPAAPLDISRALNELNADISFALPTSKESQLVLLKVEGKELLDLLEEDFNANLNIGYWIPSPFRREGDLLYITINGVSVQQKETYTILTDLEGAQSNRTLTKAIFNSGSRPLAQFSWGSFLAQDEVSTKLAAKAD